MHMHQRQVRGDARTSLFSVSSSSKTNVVGGSIPTEVEGRAAISLWREVDSFSQNINDDLPCNVIQNLVELNRTLNDILERTRSRKEEMDKMVEDVRRTQKYIKGMLTCVEERNTLEEPMEALLQELRDLAYETEDLLGVYEYYKMAKHMERHEEEQMPFNEMEVGMKSIKERFSAWKDNLCTTKNLADRKITTDDWRGSGSMPPHRDMFIGRNEQMEELRKLLGIDEGGDAVDMIANPDVNDVEFIAVVGMGGVGKTTLCQHIYNDPIIGSKFPLKGWVHVRQSSEAKSVANDILNVLTNGESVYPQISIVQEKLMDVVKEKRFLLVLDDVWIKDAQFWEQIQALFAITTKGSKILITTRDENVAREAGAEKFKLGCLSEEDGWLLFSKHAFRSLGRQHHLYQELFDIGKHIFQKCGGLPLAIVVLGKLLWKERENMERWREISSIDWWDFKDEDEREILRSLLLSYRHLDVVLKACFRFLSLFKKGETIPIKKLTELWIANNVFSDAPGNISIEQCIRDLVSRSILELDVDGREGWVRMHELTQGIARFVSGTEFCNEHFLDANECSKLLNNVRHLSLYGLHIQYCTLQNAWLRTLLFHGSSSFIGLHVVRDRGLRLLAIENGKLMEFEYNHLQAFKNLRALRIQDSCMKEVPETLYELYNLRLLVLTSSPITSVSVHIGNLKNLQYLNLSKTDMGKMPESVTKLTALQELDLHECKKLVELPSGITALTNLRALDVSGTHVTYLPRGLSKLKQLIYLPYFPLGSKKEHAQLKVLNTFHLKEKLHIGHLDCFKHDEDGVNITSKNLQELVLDFSGHGAEGELEASDVASEKHEETLELLKPHCKIRKLKIHGYQGLDLPSWMGDGSFDKLIEIELCNLRRCSSLSHLENLPSINSLRIKNCKNLESWYHGNQCWKLADKITWE